MLLKLHEQTMIKFLILTTFLFQLSQSDLIDDIEQKVCEPLSDSTFKRLVACWRKIPYQVERLNYKVTKSE